jgi:hypothetical protein
MRSTLPRTTRNSQRTDDINIELAEKEKKCKKPALENSNDAVLPLASSILPRNRYTHCYLTDEILNRISGQDDNDTIVLSQIQREPSVHLLELFEGLDSGLKTERYIEAKSKEK